MADITLSDGREITFDLNKISIREYRALFKVNQPDDEEYASLARVAGLKPEDVSSLSYVEWRKFCFAFFEKARQPLADPNSLGASTNI